MWFLSSPNRNKNKHPSHICTHTQMLQYHACACYCIHCHIVINDLNSIARAPTLECVFKVKCSRDHESIYIANIIKPYGKTDYHSQSAKINQPDRRHLYCFHQPIPPGLKNGYFLLRVLHFSSLCVYAKLEDSNCRSRAQ